MKKIRAAIVGYGNIGKYKCNNCGAHNPEAKYHITQIGVDKDSYKFKINNGPEIKLGILGTYNLYNALGAVSLALESKIDIDTIKIKLKNSTANVDVWNFLMLMEKLY